MLSIESCLNQFHVTTVLAESYSRPGKSVTAGLLSLSSMLLRPLLFVGLNSPSFRIPLSALFLRSIYFSSKYYPFFAPIVVDFVNNTFTFSNNVFVCHKYSTITHPLFSLSLSIVFHHFLSFACVSFGLISHSLTSAQPLH